MFGFIALYLFAVGLCFGSFALALVDRMRVGKDWVKGRSECDHCKHKLAPIDLFPVVSWVQARGACRYCRKKLSAAYPLVELASATLFCLSFVYWPYELVDFYSIATFITWLVAVVIMVALLVFDIRWYLLPNKLIYPLIATGVVFASLITIQTGFSTGVLVDYILAILVGAGLFAMLFIVSSGKWIGDGDVRFGIAVGLFTGVWTQAWLVIFLASIIGLIVTLPVLISTKTKAKKKLELKVPFGPMLITGLFIVVLFGERVVSWYSTEILLL